MNKQKTEETYEEILNEVVALTKDVKRDTKELKELVRELEDASK